MPNVIPWTEIESFSSIRKFAQAYPEIVEAKPVEYRAKVKLHGTCAGIQTGRNPVAQSRTTIVTPGSDNYGFALWVESTKDYWSSILEDWIVFGEWSGPGIQKSVALSSLPNRVFAVFAMHPVDPEKDRIIVEPGDLRMALGDIPNTYILPWHPLQVTIDWLGEVDPLEVTVKQINQAVNDIEICDPWVKENFGIEGVGEGLVFYPVSHSGLKNFNNLVFKAKGEKHKNISKAAPAQVNPEVAASIEEFANLVLTPARLEQGASAVGSDFEMKSIGKFIAWISTDVQKETKNELKASSLEWKQVEKAVLAQAKAWYIEKGKTL